MHHPHGLGCEGAGASDLSSVLVSSPASPTPTPSCLLCLRMSSWTDLLSSPF